METQSVKILHTKTMQPQRFVLHNVSAFVSLVLVALMLANSSAFASDDHEWGHNRNHYPWAGIGYHHYDAFAHPGFGHHGGYNGLYGGFPHFGDHGHYPFGGHHDEHPHHPHHGHHHGGYGDFGY